MAGDENKDAIRQLFAAWSRGDMGAMASCWAPDAVNHGAGRSGQAPPPGPEGMRRVFMALQLAFPDRQWHIEDIVAEGDMVMCRVTASGTFGQLPPIPVEGTGLLSEAPTGKPYSVQQSHAFRMADGKIAEHWATRDDLGLLQQLGGVPFPARSGGSQETSSRLEANKTLARRFIETIFNQKRTEALPEFLAPDVRMHHSGREFSPSLEEVGRHQRAIFAGIPDLHYEIEDVLAEEDRVFVRITMSGTHQGEYWGVPGTGKQVRMTSMHALQIADGKIAETWLESDAAGMRRQLESAEPVTSPA